MCHDGVVGRGGGEAPFLYCEEGCVCGPERLTVVIRW